MNQLLFFLISAILIFFARQASAQMRSDEKIQGYQEYIELQEKFERERMGALDEYLKSKKTDSTEWEKERLQYVEQRKKEMANSVSLEGGAAHKEYEVVKANFESAKAKAYVEYDSIQSKIRSEAKSKKMLAFEMKELGLDKENEKNRVDPRKRHQANNGSGGLRSSSGGGGGGGGGGSSSGGGYIPPPPVPGGGYGEGMDDMESPPPPEFDEGENVPVPPVPPPID